MIDIRYATESEFDYIYENFDERMERTIRTNKSHKLA